MSDEHVSKRREIRLRSIQSIRDTHPVDASQQIEATEAVITELSTELEQLREEKQQLIEETKQAIAEEKKEWKEEKRLYIDEAKKEGHEAGFETGKNESIETYRTLIERANAIVKQTETDYHKEMANNEETIVKLAVQIAGKILQDTLNQYPESFMNIVKTVLYELKESGRITIYLHPDNYEYVFRQKDELMELLEETKKVSIYADDTLLVNSCIVEHPYGQIDATIDTQLQQVRNALLEIASGNGNGN